MSPTRDVSQSAIAPYSASAATWSAIHASTAVCSSFFDWKIAGDAAPAASSLNDTAKR